MRSIVVHSASLTLVNLLSIVLADAGDRLVNPADSTAFQAPVAFTLTCALFVGWALAGTRAFPVALAVDRPCFFRSVWLGALILAPIGFALIHRAAAGSWPPPGGWTGVLVFQLITNSVAVPVAREAIRIRGRAPR
jgi:hypothetical protein